MKEYDKRPDATAEIFADDGFLLSGLLENSAKSVDDPNYSAVGNCYVFLVQQSYSS